MLIFIVMSDIGVNDLLKAILAERFKKGVRSKYPECYLWIDDKVWLIMSAGVFNLGAGWILPHAKTNELVIKELDKLGIEYVRATIGVFASNHDDIRLYKSGGIENVYQALINVERRLVKMGRIPQNRILPEEVD